MGLDSRASPALASALRLSQVTAAASVVNLGVSAIGFAVVAHKLNVLQSSVGALSQLVSQNHTDAQRSFDGLSAQLVELRYLALEGSEILRHALADLRMSREDTVDAFLARVLTRVDVLSRSARVTDVDAREALIAFGEARRWSEQTMARSALSPDRWTDWLLRFRLWCLAGSAELHLLRRIGDDAIAARLARQLAHRARQWCGQWRDAFLPPGELHGAFRFAHSAFVGLERETYERLVRLFDGTELRATDARELDGRMAAAKEIARRGPRWIHQQRALADVLDFIEETTDRIESTADELEFCLEERLSFAQWESLPNLASPGALAAIDMEATR
jgi:hypothetical protein